MTFGLYDCVSVGSEYMNTEVVSVYTKAGSTLHTEVVSIQWHGVYINCGGDCVCRGNEYIYIYTLKW